MSYFAMLGKPMVNGSATLQTGTTSAVIFTPKTDEWTDVYSIVITSSDNQVNQLTISDGTTTLTYSVGAVATGNPIVDQGDIPVRFKKGTAITAVILTAGTGKVFVNLRALTSKT